MAGLDLGTSFRYVNHQLHRPDLHLHHNSSSGDVTPGVGIGHFTADDEDNNHQGLDLASGGGGSGSSGGGHGGGGGDGRIGGEGWCGPLTCKEREPHGEVMKLP